MTEKDLIITPLWFILLMIGAYLIRPYVTDQNTRRYFMPALTIRFIAAILLGVLYQFYYGGGDTFNYHTHGSVHIYEAFQDSLLNGIKMLFASGEYISGTYEYASKIRFYNDPSSYFVIKIAAFFDLFTFGTYSATALFFALFSFSGLWALYQTFYRQYKNLHFYLAIAILFFPSVVFWGSGLLKDTIVLGALGWGIYFFYKQFIKGQFDWRILLLLLNFYIIYQVKIYIILALLPPLLLWGLLLNIDKIRHPIMRMLIAPMVLIVGGVIVFMLLDVISASNPKYAFENISETAKITAYDIGFYTGRDAGSGYSLGELDGSFESMIKLFPAAVNVSLFRPYLWEVNNPLMLFCALESIFFLILTLLVISKILYFGNLKPLRNPLMIFLLTFSIIFAFAVGVSTFNFGTLVRYKIPLLPLYASALIIILNFFKKTDQQNQFQLSGPNNF